MIENAQIDKVTISMADHGCLTYFLYLTMAKGGCCGYGGYCIGHGYLGSKNFEGSATGLEAMMRIMDTVGVERWEDLEGKYIRVESDGWGSSINKIGNLMEDKWFDQEEFFKNHK